MCREITAVSIKRGGIIVVNPKVSVIVPVYNAENFLCQCIDSILNQKLKEIEIILINDGSLDKSGKICDDYAIKDERVRVLHIQNQGVSNARNIGIQISSGKYIGFVDADDWIDEQMYVVLLEKITKENADIIMCSHVIYDRDTENIISFPWKNDCAFEFQEIRQKVIPAFISNIDINGYKQQLVMGCVWKCLFTKDLIERNKINFDEKIVISEDLVFILHAFSRSERVIFIMQPYYYYRKEINKDSTTQKYIPDAYLSLKLSLEYICNVLQELDCRDKLVMQIEWRNISNVLDCIANLFRKGSPYTFKEKIDETKGYIKDSNFKKSIKIVGSSTFTPKKKFLIMLMKHSLIEVVIIFYTIRHKLKKGESI
jgi:glycosyltransferase involved in cell wall biosynthesis